MSAPPGILELVARFERNREAYRSPGYNETQARREFIDPFFKALGWDVDNEGGLAEAYKDVIHEDAIKIGGATKAPDYCFRIGGARKFFVEAKKPVVGLSTDSEPAYQLRRYAWTSKLPLSILTDFEEFAVYDCRIRPAPTDKAATARVFYCTCDEYVEKWEWISGLFAKDAVLKGAFDKYAESNRRKKGTAEVDAEFLKEIERWRESLAQNFALRNADLSVRDLNFAVQRTIDRIVFLRMCEDRGIEHYGALQGLLNGAAVYERLGVLLRSADDRYNSGLFYFTPESGRGPADELTLALRLDDRVLKDILKSLYYPDSPYEFSVLPPEILGQVYEQFLGKVIRLTAGHYARVEEKPEVRKAGGVYYTPTYIVDYIVKQTVGKLLEDRTPAEVGPDWAGGKQKRGRKGTARGSEKEPPPGGRGTDRGARPLRVLDPACGSGSFLLGAYQYLLDWHRDWYVNDGPQKHADRVHQGAGGQWRLTIQEKKRILLNSIYGVDIDAQAVETTKLSLLLKVLEGETGETIGATLRLFHERALPDLDRNIKCGNSLIGPDFYNGQQMSLFDEEERYRINAFDWQAEFPAAFSGDRRGFDAVIGNPPYGASIHGDEKAYLRQRYDACSAGLDSYVLFMQRALQLALTGAIISFIVPTGWYTGADFAGLRRHVASVSDPLAFVNLPYDVFRAWVDTTVFVTRKRAQALAWPRAQPCQARLKTFPKRHRIATADEIVAGCQEVNFAEWFGQGNDEYLTFADAEATRVIRKMESSGVPLGQLADVQRGVTPLRVTARASHRTSRRAFQGTVRRYRFDPGPTAYVRFDESIAEPKPERYFTGPRLLLRELIDRHFRLQAVWVEDDFVTNKSMQSILGRGGGPDLYYLLGVINSRLMSWYFVRKSSVAQRDDFPKIVLKESRSLPIACVDLGSASGRRSHDRLAALARQMLDLHHRIGATKTAHEHNVLQRQIDATDRQIDQFVYELYGLTKEQIHIVEEATQ